MIDSVRVYLDGPSGAGALTGQATYGFSRPDIAALYGARFVGEFYGLYAMVLWGHIADTLGLGRPAAVASLLVFIVLAFVVLQAVDDRPRE